MTDEDGSDSRLTKIVDLAIGAASGVPVPVQKGLAKAFERLCLATVEVPAAYLEGLADERRAVTAARVALASTMASRLGSSGVISPEVSQAAVNLWTKKVLGRQANLDAVVASAAEHVIESSNVPGSQPEEATPKVESGESASGTIDDDWLNIFEREAEHASADTLRDAFGRILAGECQRPGSFSKATVRIVAQLSQESAEGFQTLCNLASRLRWPSGLIEDVRVWSLGLSPGGNAMSKFGINYSSLLDLMEAGLIHSELESGVTYGTLTQSSRGVSGAFEYAGSLWGLMPFPNTSSEGGPTDEPINGISFTRAGRELSEIVTTVEDASYTRALKEYLKARRFVRCKVYWDATRQRYAYRPDEPADSD